VTEGTVKDIARHSGAYRTDLLFPVSNRLARLATSRREHGASHYR
jgi:hypothetical protein